MTTEKRAPMAKAFSTTDPRMIRKTMRPSPVHSRPRTTWTGGSQGVSRSMFRRLSLKLPGSVPS